MKYLVRAIKYFFWFSILFALIMVALVLLGIADSSPELMFRDGWKSVAYIAVLFGAVAAFYPKFGFITKDVVIPGGYSDIRDGVVEVMESRGYRLESEEGQLYQEIIDQSPVGLVMAMAIAKNSEVTAQMKNWSKDLLFQKLSQFESTLLQNAKEAAKKQPSNGQPQTPTQTRPSTSGIPSTGSVGKTQAPATFNAKDWLRKNRPERYPTH